MHCYKQKTEKVFHISREGAPIKTQKITIPAVKHFKPKVLQNSQEENCLTICKKRKQGEIGLDINAKISQENKENVNILNYKTTKISKGETFAKLNCLLEAINKLDQPEKRFKMPMKTIQTANIAS
jgi:hypothetical protein